jgi:hypothetical protein
VNLAKKQNKENSDRGRATVSSAPDTQESGEKFAEKPEAFLVTTQNSKKFAQKAAQVLSPVQVIQDRLHSEFSAEDPVVGPTSKDLRLNGIVFAILFSVAAWTLILQVLF